MRTLCDVCEAAPARFFCAADEAALCPVCDDKVHRCNKLANRHVRVRLAEARAVPPCDICENAPAFFFCGIDGTSLCLQCDLGVHVGGKRSHERYLLLGQRVEFINKKPTVVEDVVLHHINAAKDLKGQQCQRLHQNKLYERFLEKMDNSKARANTVAVNDADCEQHASKMIDLNSRPLQLQGQASNSCQNMRDVEVVSSSSDDEYGGVLRETPLKGKDR